MQNQSPKHFYSLQILRTYAAGVVVLYHMTRQYMKHDASILGNFFHFGYSGVDVFFVLSGFIISYTTFINKQPEGGKAAIYFFAKRSVRIYPSYWILLLFPILVLAFLAPQLVSQIDHLNVFSFLEAFFLLFDHIHLSQVTWTLSFEMYFYLLFTAIVFNRKAGYLIAIVFIGCLINLAGVRYGYRIIDNYLLDSLCLEFAMGVGIAALIRHFKTNKKQSIALLVIGCGLLFTSAILSIQAHHFRVLAFGLPSAIIVYALVNYERYIKLSANNWLVKLGDASYVTYLIHSPLVSASALITFKVFDQGNTIVSLLVVCLIHLIAWLVYILIEQRILQFNKKIITLLKQKLA